MAGSIKIADKEAGDWKEHPRFAGVLMKNLLTAADNPLANVNAVRVPPGRVIGLHLHGQQAETIYVIAGESVLNVAGVDLPFNAGQVAVVPGGVEHWLRNDSVETVELLTIFTPPL
jgi:quercetin dioxygenase-like cupin family protein